jgi:phospholipid/cholesterol/gamma-HCH transport system permease protein
MAEQELTGLKKWMEEVGEQVSFLSGFFRNLFTGGFEWSEFVRQCYEIGYRSITLVGITSFIMGVVLTLQSRPTLVKFGAVSMLPLMVCVSIIREIGPVITAIICAGKVSSGIGAELGSMKVTEQIDAMEVSGANPMQYLVVTRILATTIMIPILTLMGDVLGLFGGFLADHFADHTSWQLYFNKCVSSIGFTDLFPAFIKSIFFGFAVGFIGCYKGFNSNRGTESVGIAANSAVVSASLWIFFLDVVAVQVTQLIFY